jgi:hypothetical protein
MEAVSSICNPRTHHAVVTVDPLKLFQYHQEQQWRQQASLSHSRFGLKGRGHLAVMKNSTTELVISFLN